MKIEIQILNLQLRNWWIVSENILSMWLSSQSSLSERFIKISPSLE